MLLPLVWLAVLFPSSQSSASSASRCEMGQAAQRRAYRRRRTTTVICRPCAPGQYGAAPGTCLPCPAAQWQAAAGQTQCMGTPCPAGRYGALGTAAPPADPCHPCAPGRAQPLAGTGGCVPCPAGTAVAAEGRTTCDEGAPCAPGTSGRTGQTQLEPQPCVACRAGRFSARPGQAQCRRCPSGQWQPRTGQLSCVLQPSCGRFTYWEAGQCVSAHPHLRTLVLVSWTIFALNLASMCCCPGPDSRYLRSTFGLIFAVSLACGIITLQRRSPMSSATVHVLAALLSVVGLLLLERVARALVRQYRLCC